MLPFRCSFVVVSLAASLLLTPRALRAAPVSFNRDIRPIMSDTCFHCHGNDPKSRKAGMRLDLREEALKPTKNDFLPIVPGKPDESEIILRINDPDEPMPPPEAHKALTAAQKDLFRRWVAEGAVYEPHWAYATLTRPAIPATAATQPKEPNPVDAFIRAKLAEKNIRPSPEAPKARLLRRVSLDLTGLPPTPEEVTAFLNDRSPNAYEKQVDRLLASPHHGERMAVWWLDIARFADTVGFHGDQNQRVFPYRDYVINGFNANKRFDQFTIEQLAGDLLPAPTTEQIVATGYNRLNMMTREGGAQAREYLSKYGAERVRSVAAAWFGSTFGCAECHDHKFDPIKTRDFYSLESFFADVKQWGVYSDYAYTPNPDLVGFTNDHPFPPEIEVESPYLMARKQRLEAELATERTAFTARLRDASAAKEFSTWLADARAYLERNASGWAEATILPEAAKAAKTPKAPKTGKVVAQVPVTTDSAAPAAAIKTMKRPASAASVVVQPEPGRIAALRIDLTDAPPPEMGAKKKAARSALKFVAAIRDANGRERKLDFVFADATTKDVRYEGGQEVIGIVSGWKLPATGQKDPLTGVWLLAAPQTIAEGEKLVISFTGEAPANPHVFTSPFAATDPLALAQPSLCAAIRAGDASQPNDLLASTWLLSTASDRPSFERQHQLAAKIRETRDGRAWSLITQSMAPFTIRVLPRGNWQDESGDIVLPSTPSFLPGRKESTPEHRLTRLDLARWIVSKENPITARVVMNRTWAMFFGTGLSASVDDLGSQGELPSHPELLDWLASEFRDSGWDLRHMIRLIVTSATYRQNSSQRTGLRDVDPNNRLLAAQNPRRLEAEFVRDTALFTAGILNLRDIGGPSVKPYQPAGYYAALQFPDRDYVPSKDDEQWRRGVYMHWQRTFLHPMLANFDAPARDECAAARTVSNTPQQALTLLNDPEFVEAARELAARVVQPGTSDEARLHRVFLLAFAREPKPAEVASLKSFLATQREYYRSHSDDAAKLLHVGYEPAPVGDAAELAAWTQVARVLINAQEFITRY